MPSQDGRSLVFDAISIREVVPEPYDPNIYAYRYANGARADRLPGFANTRRDLERILTTEPRTAESLSRELGVELRQMQAILDYLFTHSGDLAALELPGRETLYIWAGIDIAEEIRSRISVRGLSIDTRRFGGDEITALSAYLTNLIALNPPIEVYDAAIEKCLITLESAKVLLSIKGSADLEQRVALLSRKLEELTRRRDLEVERWSRANRPADGAADTPRNEARFEETTSIALGESPRKSRKELYRFDDAYLLGPSYRYSGPDADRRFRADDPRLGRLDFSGVRRVVVELSFAEELKRGVGVLDLIDHHLGTIFPEDARIVRFRRIPGMKYPNRVERRLHALVLALRERGYRVIDNTAKAGRGMI